MNRPPAPSTARRPGVPAPVALKVLAALALLLWAGGCARRAAPVPETPARLAWQSFQDARKAALQAAPGLSARASLQYSGPRRKSRVLLKLWGELGYPLRLDMEAGIGATIAMLREDGHGWTAYFPQSGEAAVNSDPRRGLEALGVDAPLSLADLAGLATGTYQGLVPAHYASAQATGDGGWTYTLQGDGPVRRLTLDALARPTAMHGTLGGETWEMALTGFEDIEPGAVPTARKLTLERGTDTRTAIRVVIRIKELTRQEPWPAEAMVLVLPPGTRFIPPASPGNGQ